MRTQEFNKETHNVYKIKELIEKGYRQSQICRETGLDKKTVRLYRKIPVITDFTDENGKDCMKEMIQENYNRIKSEVKQIVADELQRIQNGPVLCKLPPDK